MSAGGDTWGSAVAEAELQEQLDDAQLVLQEQDKVCVGRGRQEGERGGGGARA